jgi:hypothetical protein
LVIRIALAGIATRQATTGAGQLLSAGQVSGELACWQLAGAVGLLTVAVRPGSAEALLPLLAVAGTLTAAVSVRGIADGATTATGESVHLWFEIGLAATIVVWILTQGDSAAEPRNPAPFGPRTGKWPLLGPAHRRYPTQGLPVLSNRSVGTAEKAQPVGVRPARHQKGRIVISSRCRGRGG